MYRVLNLKFTSLTAVILTAFVLIFNSSCGGASDTSRSSQPSTYSPASATPELELSGEYVVTGTDENKARPYNGLLTVSNQGEAYKFNWRTSRSRHNGVGVQIGDDVAVTYADIDKGKGCGVALYKIDSDGNLDGKIAKWGETVFGSEKAVKFEGHNFDGKYKVTGTATDGKAYEGIIDVSKNGSGYQFKWQTGNNLFGCGILQGNRAAIGFGGRQCSFALYKVMSGRSLDGHWGSQRDIVFGTETAKRQ